MRGSEEHDSETEAEGWERWGEGGGGGERHAMQGRRHDHARPHAPILVISMLVPGMQAEGPRVATTAAGAGVHASARHRRRHTFAGSFFFASLSLFFPCRSTQSSPINSQSASGQASLSTLGAVWGGSAAGCRDRRPGGRARVWA